MGIEGFLGMESEYLLNDGEDDGKGEGGLEEWGEVCCRVKSCAFIEKFFSGFEIRSSWWLQELLSGLEVG